MYNSPTVPRVEWDLGVMKGQMMKWSFEAAKTWVEFKVTKSGSISMNLAEKTQCMLNLY